jgi:hypothetical protein
MKTHYSIGENEPHVSICGRFGVPGTRVKADVTCKQCLQALANPSGLQREFVGR